MIKSLTEMQRTNYRYERLPEHLKDLLNSIALNEFEKPITERKKAVDLIDSVEF